MKYFLSLIMCYVVHWLFYLMLFIFIVSDRKLDSNYKSFWVFHNILVDEEEERKLQFLM